MAQRRRTFRRPSERRPRRRSRLCRRSPARRRRCSRSWALLTRCVFIGDVDCRASPVNSTRRRRRPWRWLAARSPRNYSTGPERGPAGGRNLLQKHHEEALGATAHGGSRAGDREARPPRARVPGNQSETADRRTERGPHSLVRLSLEVTLKRDGRCSVVSVGAIRPPLLPKLLLTDLTTTTHHHHPPPPLPPLPPPHLAAL